MLLLLNYLSTFKSKDDVLTLLIHLGYLGYDPASKQTFIPNEEIRGAFITSINVSHWDELNYDKTTKKLSCVIESFGHKAN